ncbi:MAG: MtrB/PioB family outer membrane beta-barrel protein [Acidobacteriota bacterium]|nr:MtrB/PioB family outer membrane beta-barrel protein [Acidobacteriota bacterium]
MRMRFGVFLKRSVWQAPESGDSSRAISGAARPDHRLSAGSRPASQANAGKRLALLVCPPLMAGLALFAQDKQAAQPAPSTPSGAAQQAAQPAAAAAAAPAEPAATQSVAQPEPAPSPAPSAENWLTGSIDLGYRWVSGVGGSLPTYRSVVNLGSGMKLIGSDFTILDPKRRLFDRVRVRALDWGDDPYESLHVLAEKQNWYEFNADFRRVSYFNNVPSFADPLLTRGTALDEQSFDTRRTLGSFGLEMMPNSMISPYIGYDRDSSNGTGVTVFHTDADEFAVPADLRDSTDLFRGGFHITGNRWHITIEEGGTTFRTDQNTYTSTNLAPNPGNVTTPILGQTQGLTSLLQAYGVRGNGIYTKAILTLTPTSWLDVYGHFLYSQPQNDVNYQQFNNGNFVLLNQALLYTSEQYLVSAVAKLPHTSGDIGWEVRPTSRIRILQSWMTDRLHNASSALQDGTFVASMLGQSLAANYSSGDTTAIVEVSKKLTVRGGYRYVWGDAFDTVLPLEGIPAVSHEYISRHVGMGGATWRPSSRLSLTGEFEIGSSTGEYFRTSLYDYKKVRAMGRYRILDTLNISGDYSILTNRDPNLDASYKYINHREAVTLNWNPAKKHYNMEASYEHCGYHSQIGFLVPALLSPDLSVYTEYCHAVTALLHAAYGKVEFSGGGAVSLVSGSSPTAYYQPVAKVSYSVTKNMGLFAEWRYYGLNEAFYLFESFRTQMLTAGLRFTR